MKETNEFTVKIKALTPIWTGDENRKCETLRETGMIGSLRWWYEALIRGLGGYACDPTDENSRCKLDQKKFNEALKAGIPVQEALNQQICPVCQLFGCTGWARKFRLEINIMGNNKINKGRGPTSGLKPGTFFDLNLILFSTLTAEQKWLFKKNLWLIENYGAIGGRTTWKPNSKWGTSYGLIKIEDYGELANWDTLSNIYDVKKYLKYNKDALKKENTSNWFNFAFYWIIDKSYLNHKQINVIVKRNPNNPKNYDQKADEFDKWLGRELSSEKSVSKKIFSFKNPYKVFGYVKNKEELEEVKKRIQNVLNNEINFKTGEKILGELK
ncbi:MAG: type III-B CRISPR module RAMP protein Cmr1 [Caldisericum exile]|uniref:Type III-B CRISPR module RAMP protein Cmr1 n=1 Tax=Caldisericum exile TaxID=693075 RepID=A0A2J6X5K6_9BACT|nr:MAG: type III-B CRISPR module RAMP protein Cmr1 [Caldisericum exile]